MGFYAKLVAVKYYRGGKSSNTGCTENEEMLQVVITH